MQEAVFPIAEQIVGELRDHGRMHAVVSVLMLIPVLIPGWREGQLPRQTQSGHHRGVGRPDQAGVPERRQSLLLPWISHVLRLAVGSLPDDVPSWLRRVELVEPIQPTTICRGHFFRRHSEEHPGFPMLTNVVHALVEFPIPRPVLCAFGHLKPERARPDKPKSDPQETYRRPTVVRRAKQRLQNRGNAWIRL